MKRALIAGLALCFLMAGVVLAADSGQQANVPGPNFDQNKAQMLKMLDERMVGLQEAKTCIQTAQNPDEIRVCKEKHRAAMMEKRGEMKPQRGMGGPMGR